MLGPCSEHWVWEGKVQASGVRAGRWVGGGGGGGGCRSAVLQGKPSWLYAANLRVCLFKP